MKIPPVMCQRCCSVRSGLTRHRDPLQSTSGTTSPVKVANRYQATSLMSIPRSVTPYGRQLSCSAAILDSAPRSLVGQTSQIRCFMHRITARLCLIFFQLAFKVLEITANVCVPYPRILNGFWQADTCRS